ncbi:MAG: class I SAM-dependent methyltransferase [Bacteroidota bacterium]|jgi:SAM-dependent methyltransferase
MDSNQRKLHWENIYATKDLQSVSWYQSKPEPSLQFVKDFNIPKDAKIIDVGGGDSLFIDYLIDLGYSNLTVVDISEVALEKAKKRLGNKSDLVNWIVADISNFVPPAKYDFWHDRAAFHFLTNEEEINNYVKTVKQYLNENGLFVVGTFSENGPEKCSGITIKQYSEVLLDKLLGNLFIKVKCFVVDHKTPFDTIQNFIFCSFRNSQTN